MIICTVSLLIPVFNSPDCLRDLFITLENNTSKDLIKEIIIGDDGSDTFTKNTIKQIISDSQFDIKLISQTNNIGYLKNTNIIYKEAVTDLVVILNTDTLVPKNWIERVVDTFLSAEDIVIATPFSTNASNLTILPAQGQSWTDIDEGLSLNIPKYPDAHTAVGFCMAVRKKMVDRATLFDENFIYGYWEETDLHYYILSRGFRSVVIDNLLVYHASGSASFSSNHGGTGNLQSISNDNKRIFDRKWREIHIKNEKHYLRTKPYDYVRNADFIYNFTEENRVIDILFILPNLVGDSDEINIIIDLCKWLNINNIRTSIYSYGHVDERYIRFLGLLNPWRTEQDIYYYIANIKTVCAINYPSMQYARKFSKHYNSQIFYFIQNLEILYNYGKDFRSILDTYQDNRLAIFCASKALLHYLKECGASNINFIPVGAESYRFYSIPQEVNGIRNNKAIAACLRHGKNRNSGMILYTLSLAKKAGFELHLFGEDVHQFDIPSDFAYVRGHLKPSELRLLFNTVGYYLDMASCEEVNLLPLEASNCGAIPILGHNSCNDYIFSDNQNCIFIDSILTQGDFFVNLFQKDAQAIDFLRENALMVSKNYSIHEMRNSFLHYISKMFKDDFTAPRKITFVKKKKLAKQSVKGNIVKRIFSKVYAKHKEKIHFIFYKIVEKASNGILIKLNEIEKRLIKQEELLNKLYSKHNTQGK